MSVTVAVVLVLGYVGMLGAESVEFRPARIVDAVVDTNNLAIGTAVYPQASSDSAALAITDDAGWQQQPSGQRTGVEVTTVVSTPLPTIARSTIITTPPGAVTTAATSPSTTSSTSTTLVPTTPPPLTLRQRGELALASFDYDWQAGLPGWEFSFHPGRDGVLGYTFVREKRIEIYVRNQMSDSLLAHVIAHEMGHAIDVTDNNGDDRRRWQRLRGIEDNPWWPSSGATDFSTGAGDFAESFAAWQLGNASFRSKLGPPPDTEARALMSELVNG
ncbi:MAG: hypothetical protein KJN63_09415 [Acidimicrobiia bacterium]|nr:hypothetical protein [Acidimicrobiia bacterium]